jgi:hypothetical protein
MIKSPVGTKEMEKCDKCAVYEALLHNRDIIERIKSFLDGRGPTPGLSPSPVSIPPGMTTYDDARRGIAGAKWTSYCNENKVSDPCIKFCICRHETVHLSQGPGFPSSTPEDLARAELPAYEAGASCLRQLYSLLK